MFMGRGCGPSTYTAQATFCSQHWLTQLSDRAGRRPPAADTAARAAVTSESCLRRSVRRCAFSLRSRGSSWAAVVVRGGLWNRHWCSAAAAAVAAGLLGHDVGGQRVVVVAVRVVGGAAEGGRWWGFFLG